jgi:hypothetical protein
METFNPKRAARWDITSSRVLPVVMLSMPVFTSRKRKEEGTRLVTLLLRLPALVVRLDLGVGVDGGRLATDRLADETGVGGELARLIRLLLGRPVLVGTRDLRKSLCFASSVVLPCSSLGFNCLGCPPAGRGGIEDDSGSLLSGAGKGKARGTGSQTSLGWNEPRLRPIPMSRKKRSLPALGSQPRFRASPLDESCRRGKINIEQATPKNLSPPSTSGLLLLPALPSRRSLSRLVLFAFLSYSLVSPRTRTRSIHPKCEIPYTSFRWIHPRPLPAS